MLANFFHKSSFQNSVILIGLLLLHYFFQLYLNSNTYLNAIWNLSFIILISLFQQFINTKNNLSISNATNFLLFISIFCLFPKSMLETNILAANYFLLLAFRRIYSIKNEQNVREKIFDSAIWISIAILFNPWNGLFFILLYTSLFLFNKLNAQHATLPLLGFITILFLSYTYFYITNGIQLFNDYLYINANLEFSPYNNFKLLIPISLIVTISLWIFLFKTNKVIRTNNEFRLLNYLIVIHFLLASIIVLFHPNKNGSEFLYLAFPIAILVSNYMQKINEKWFLEILYYSFILLPIILLAL